MVETLVGTGKLAEVVRTPAVPAGAWPSGGRGGRRGVQLRLPDSTARTRPAGAGALAVTGRDQGLGAAFLAALACRPGPRRLVALGADPRPRSRGTGDRRSRVRALAVDLQDPRLVEALRSARVETVVHTDLDDGAEGGDASFEHDVLGTMHLLAAAARAGVRTVVIAGHAQVYGARPEQVGLLRETSPLAAGGSPWLRRRVEVERVAGDFAERHPEVRVTVLRFAHRVGPWGTSRLSAWLAAPLVPTALGFDPLVQCIHEEDAVGALLCAVEAEVPGAVNVASWPPLPLSQVVALAGRRALPCVTPVTWPVVEMAHRFGLSALAPLGPDELRFPCLVDTARMRLELGFRPRRGIAAALRALGRSLRRIEGA